MDIQIPSSVAGLVIGVLSTTFVTWLWSMVPKRDYKRQFPTIGECVRFRVCGQMRTWTAVYIDDDPNPKNAFIGFVGTDPPHTNHNVTREDWEATTNDLRQPNLNIYKGDLWSIDDQVFIIISMSNKGVVTLQQNKKLSFKKFKHWEWDQWVAALHRGKRVYDVLGISV